MKHAVALAWSTCTIVVVALIVLLGMNLTVWSGPNSSSPVVDLNNSHGGIPNVFDLRVGENQIGHSEGTVSRFVLKAAKPYVLTLCGNNGWGRIRCSSKPFRLTSR